MILERDWKGFKELHSNIAGAREAFANTCEDLFRQEHLGEDVSQVRVHQGDGGVDVYVGKIGVEPIIVYQCKFFLETVGKSQKEQIRKSFKTVISSKEFEVKKWVVCIATQMSIDENIWFNKWAKEQETELEKKDLIFKKEGNELISLLQKHELYNKHFEIDVKNQLNNIEKILQDWKKDIIPICHAVLDEILVNIKSFKPKTALSLLINTIEKHLKDEQEVNAKYYFVKGICEQELQDKNANESFIKAYSIDNETIEYQEKAIVAYIDNKECAKAETIVEKIIQKKPLNTTANAAKYFLDKNWNCPLEINKYDDTKQHFLGILGYFYMGQERFEEVFILFAKELNHVVEVGPISFENKAYWFNLSNVAFEMLIREGDIIRINRGLRQHPKLPITQKLLSHVVKTFKNTEKSAQIIPYDFFLSFLNFIEDDNAKNQKKLLKVFQKLSIKYQKQFFFLITALLSEFHKHENVLDLLKNKDLQDKKYTKLFDEFKVRSLSKLGKIDDAQKKAKKIINNGLSVGIGNIDFCLDILHRILIDEKKQIFENLKTNNSFTHKYLELLIELSVFSSNYSNIEIDNLSEQIIDLKSESEWAEKSDKIIAYVFHDIKLWEKSNILLTQYLNNSIISEELILYVKNLRALQTKNLEILEIFEHLRLNQEFNLMFIIMELEMLDTTFEYEKIKLICQEVISYYVEDLGICFYMTKALSKLNQVIELETFINENKATFFKFSFSQLQDFIQELDKYVFFKPLQIELLYPFAKDDANIIAKEQYHITWLMNAKNKIYTEIEKGYYVILRKNDEQIILELTEINISQNPFGKKVFKEKPMVNSIFSFENQYTREVEEYSISQITDKFGALFFTISEEIRKKKLMGAATQSFQIEENEGVEGLLKVIGKLDNGEYNKHQEKIKQKAEVYKRGEESFTNFVRINEDNAIQAYLKLVFEEKCFKVVPLPDFLHIPYLQNTEYVLDNTAILLFFELSERLGLNFQHKFTISFLTKHNFEKSSILVNLIPRSDEEKKHYIPKLLKWIEQNCVVKPVREKLDILNELQEGTEEKNDDYFNYLIETMLLSNNNPNAILISDDTMFYETMYQNSSVVSTEYYFALHFKDIFINQILPVLTELNYKGILQKNF